MRRDIRHVDTVIFCVGSAVFGLMPGGTLFALLTIPLVALWLLVQLVLALLKAKRWRLLGSKVVAVAATVALLIGAQAVYARLARSAADDVRQTVLRYHAAHGAWARTLQESGWQDVDRSRRWHVTYFGENGSVTYRSTLIPFDCWWREPDDADWTFMPD